MKKIRTEQIIAIVVILVVAAIALWLVVTRGSRGIDNVPPAGQISLEGEIVCLPHRNTDGPQTLECAYGLYGDDGWYYILRDETSIEGPSTITSFPTGSRVEVRGIFVPEDDDIYASIGFISVESIIPVEDGITTGETHSDGIISFDRPEDFGLAVSDEQVPTNSVVAPCDSGFEYCLYYLGDKYGNTNFESAGISILERSDTATENSCLETPPDGYAEMELSARMTGSGYSISLFGPLQNAAAGHYSSDREYRLYTSDSCYQLTARIGESQFANHPAGSIEEFTDTDRAALMDRLRFIVSGIRLTRTGERIMLPET